MRSTAIQLDEASCTSVLQKWNQPKKKRLDSKMVEDISFESGKERKRKERKFFDPRPPSMRKTSQDELDELGDSLKTLPYTCGLTELLSPRCTSADSSIKLLPLTPSSVRARVQAELCQTPSPPPLNVIVGFGETFLKGITPTVAQKELVETKLGNRLCHCAGMRSILDD